MWLFIEKRADFNDRRPKKMLHIAPEPSLRNKFQEIHALDYVSGDLYDSKAMVKLDICNLHYSDDAFDIIICSHVLEHVDDDRKAMRELSRVLKHTGWAMFLIPITADATFEDQSITDPVERERVFGQFDHVRSYGPDFVQRLEDNGFIVHVTKTDDLVEPEEAERLGLLWGEMIFFCQKAIK